MMLNHLPMRRVLIISFLIVLLFSCGKEEEKSVPESYTHNLAKGKEALKKGFVVDAKDYFYEAMQSYPEGSEAEYGFVIAEGLWVYELIGMISSLPFQSPSYYPSENQDDVIEKYLTNIFSKLREIHQDVEEHIENLLSRKDPRFEIDSLPFFVWSQKTLDFGGKWGKGDLLALSFYFNFVDAIFSLILSQNLHADYLGTISFARKYIYGNLNGKVIGMLYAYIFIHNPDFLKLKSGGESLWRESLESFKKAFIVLDNFIGTGGGGVFKITSQGENLYLRIGKKYGETGELQPFELMLPQDYPASVSAFVENLSGNGKVILRWHEEILPFLSVMASFILSILPRDYFKGQIPESLKNLLTLVDPVTLENLVKGLLPDVFAVDLHRFLKNPTGIRDLLPYWHEELPEDQSYPYWEWECEERDSEGYPLGNYGIICREGDTFEDSDHFKDTEWEIEKDGFEGRLPYLVFRKPDFSGSFLVNLGKFKDCNGDFPSYSDTFLSPDLKQLNLWLQLLGGCVLEILQR